MLGAGSQDFRLIARFNQPRYFFPESIEEDGPGKLKALRFRFEVFFWGMAVATPPAEAQDFFGMRNARQRLC